MPNYENKRKSKRFYDLKPTWIMLKNRFIRVHDISNEGIGVVLKEDSLRFFMGEQLQNIRISLQSGDIKLKGIVSHISVTAKCDVLGIQLLLSEEDFRSMVQFKKERIQEDDDSGDDGG